MAGPLLFVSGLVFALGLGISGMTDANKVIGFLDLAGDWDPALAFVMVGAIGVHASLYRFIGRREFALDGGPLRIPGDQGWDKPLLLGAGLFGVGWGLGGYCPGPAIVSLVSLGSDPLVFCGFMVLGMVIFQACERWLVPVPERAAVEQG